MSEEFEPTSPPTFPVKLRLPHFPVSATYALIAANAIIFGLDALLGGAVFWYGALVPQLVAVYHQWWRLIVAGFLHANLAHIVFNLYALHGLGSLMERFFGLGRLLIVYGLSLLGSSVLVTLFSPPTVPTVGASGAIMGIVGALVIFFWRYRDLLVGGRRYLTELARMAIINIGIGLLPGISWWGHLGGFLAGAVAGALLLPRYERADPLTPRLALRQVSAPSRAGTALLLLAELLLLALAIWWRG